MSSASGMGKLEFGSLRDAWAGEARDFTPLLAAQLDVMGDQIGLDLLAVGQAEVATAGGRSIDIVAQSADGPEFVIENQYGRADHDHLTRGLAYAVARGARGLVVVAEEHRDEFRAVGQYLNDLAEHDPDRGISVWLVEAKAVRIAGSPWAPLFTAVIAPNRFTAQVEQAKLTEKAATLEELLAACTSDSIREAMKQLSDQWLARGHKLWRFAGYLTLAARGPAKNGERGVVAIYPNGQVSIPFGAYAGQNTGIPVPELTTPEFRAHADAVFGLGGSATMVRTEAGWLSPDTVDVVLKFAAKVTDAYAAALAG